jgi:membrane protein
LLWFYVSGLALLVGAEFNAEIEHASPYGKAPGEKSPGGKRLIGRRAARAFEQRQASPSSSDRADVVPVVPVAVAPKPAAGAAFAGSVLLLRLWKRYHAQRSH